MRPDNLLMAVISVALAFLINFYFNYILGMTSFWFVQADGVRRVVYLMSMFFSGALIPLAFFPDPLRAAQYFLPFQYTVYVPAMVFVGGFERVWVWIARQAIAALVLYGASEILYRKAMLRYCDAGA
jgi:ABC-2 type transport system permease protein